MNLRRLAMETDRETGRFFYFSGFVLILFGIFALMSPYFMTLSIELLLGSVLVASGLVQTFRAFKGKDTTGYAMSFISAAVTLIVGLLLLFYPLEGLITLTALLAIYFLVDGIASVIFAIQNWAVTKWTGLLLSGICSLILAYLIWIGWPTTALWVIGVYVGIYLLILGFSFIVMGNQIKNLTHKEQH